MAELADVNQPLPHGDQYSSHRISRKAEVNNRHKALFSGIAYMLGRTFTYVTLGFLLVSSTESIPSLSESSQKNLGNRDALGAFLLGLLFALSFCPVSAALFFGNTIAIAMKTQSRLIIPTLYGMGTAMPVFLFALIIVFSVHKIGMVYNRLALFEKWARKISSVIFILTGLYMLIQHYFY